MNYAIDHDLHIHSGLSYCSLDPEQTKERILKYALDNGFKKICVTDHFWDSRVDRLPSTQGSYHKQTDEYISTILPLPEAEGVKFLFGGETDMDYNMRIGISDEFLDKLDFLIVPITHLHMNDFTIDSSKIIATGYRLESTPDNEKYVSELWVNRFDALLNAALPFQKVGLAHLSWIPFSDPYSVARMFDLIDDKTLSELFARAAGLKMGIEINTDFEAESRLGNSTLRVYKAAKDSGCKFYFGSDSHHPASLMKSKDNFTRLANWLGLEEEDKFPFVNI